MRWREIQGKRHRDRQKRRGETENSELYYTRITIVGSSLFLQLVFVNLHASKLRIKHIDYQSKNDGQNLDSKTISLNQYGPTLHPVLSTLQTHINTK